MYRFTNQYAIAIWQQKKKTAQRFTSLTTKRRHWEPRCIIIAAARG